MLFRFSVFLQLRAFALLEDISNESFIDTWMIAGLSASAIC